MTNTISRDELAGLDLSGVTTGETIPPVTPGEVLREEFMKPLGLSARAMAAEIDVPPNRITAILNGERSVTAETAILLGRRFGTSAEFWMNLQTAHDLDVARRSMEQGPRLTTATHIVRRTRAAGLGTRAATAHNTNRRNP